MKAGLFGGGYEDYLTRKFGQTYLDYKSKVRRWL